MRKILWLLPPLLGVAFYAVGSLTIHRRAAVEVRLSQKMVDRSSAAAAEGSPSLPPAPPEGPGNDGQKEAVAEESTPSGQDRIAALSVDELRELILKLRAKIKEAKRGEVDEDWQIFLESAEDRLFALQKGDAMPWLLEHLPERREELMAKWAQFDPAAVFEAVVRSRVSEPCSMDTLGDLLHGFAVQGPGALREASLRVPWELFIGSPEATGRPYLTAKAAGDLRPWLESGVLPELQRRDVMISEVLQQWANQAPREVLAQWQAGNEMLAKDPNILCDLLSPSALRTPDQEVEIAKALSELPPQEQRRLVSLMKGEGESVDDEDFAKWKESFDPGRAAKIMEKGNHR